MALIALDFQEAPRKAFLRGLAKGMGAPLMLFASSTSAPLAAPSGEFPPATMLRLPKSLTQYSDLQRIGLDFNAAVSRYEQTNQEQAASQLRAG